MGQIDDLKALASVKLGFARANNFLVTLPARHGVDGRELNVLCTSVILPGKQIMTSPRQIGMERQMVAYGYAVDDVTMTFHLMNDYGVKKYFDNWRSKVVNEDTFDVSYKEDYVDDITIHQLRKPLVGFSRQLGPFRPNLNIGGGTVYSCKLLDAFPTTFNDISLNNELDGLLQYSVQISYTNWTTEGAASQNFLNASVSTPFGSIDVL